MDVIEPLDRYDLPVMPQLEPDLVDRHDAAQSELSDLLVAAAEPTQRLFRYVQWRLLTEAAASLEPVFTERRSPLVPSRRRLLSNSHGFRLEGCRNALRHIDGRVAMQRMGAIEHVVAAETPMVLHAFVEVNEPHGRVSNAGSIRATPSGFAEGDIEFIPPPAEHCRRLILDAVEFANTAPAPSITRATWLMAAVFALHPFVDGNGRTGRMLFHGLLSEHLPNGFDWGTIPELAASRNDYLEAARAPLRPSLPDYDARLLQPIHLMRFTAERAVDGALRAVARLSLLSDHVERLIGDGWDVGPMLVLLGIAADRNARLDELAELLGDPVETTEVVNGLVERGIATWDEAGRAQLVGANPFVGAM